MSAPRNIGLDVIRAAAVLTVIAFHGSSTISDITHVILPTWAPITGSIAVEAFYALSGYLIGRILLDLVGTPSVNGWLNFMCRRWKRTLPLYAAILAVFGLLIQPNADEFLRYATLTQNVFHAPPVDQFGHLLGPSWSLSVEEIFYLSFATIMLAASSIFGRRAVWPVIVGFLVFPVFIRTDQLLNGEANAYFSAVSNLDGIAWGVALAQLQRQGSVLFRNPVASLVAGLSLVAVAWAPYAMGYIKDWQPGTLTVASAGCCLLVAAALSVKGSLGLFGVATKAISARSYSAYLVHVPVITVVANLVGSGVLSLPVGIAVTIVITGVLTYTAHRWIEMPGMRMRMPSVNIFSGGERHVFAA